MEFVSIGDDWFRSQCDSSAVGLLPVNDAQHRGEGFVTYVVYPKSSDVSGTKINNRATIVFDDNPALDTPDRLNTIDSKSPTSIVVALPSPRKYLDVDGDGFIAPLDVLVVINSINRRGNGEGEFSKLAEHGVENNTSVSDWIWSDLNWVDELNSSPKRMSGEPILVRG